jgi:Glycosyl transferase family 2
MDRQRTYTVRSLGEGESAFVRLSASQLEEGLAICDEEIVLIDSAIQKHNIAVPPALQGERPIHRLAVTHVADASAPKLQDRKEPASDARSGPPLFAPLLGLMDRGRFAEVAAEVAQIADGGQIVVVGEDSWSLASALTALGQPATWLRIEAGSLPRRLRRPSLVEWVLACGDDLSGLGAVVLIGDKAFEAEGPLRDANAVPPIVKVSLDEKGRPHVAGSILPTAAVESWPKISLVAVSFNQAPYLEASIRSVLDQSYPNLEYIVVDGGSTDGSAEIIERYRDRCHTIIMEPDRGQSNALNKGFRHASGDIMNWLCSDDLLEPKSLEAVGRAYRRHGADFIAGGCARIGETRADEHILHHTALPLQRTVALEPLDILKFMRSWQAGRYFYQPEVFFSRRVWLESGAYIKEHLYYAMDYDLWLRMALSGATVRHIPVTIGCSRVHALQKTQNDRKYLHQMRQLMEEYRDLFETLRAHDPARPPAA